VKRHIVHAIVIEKIETEDRVEKAMVEKSGWKRVRRTTWHMAVRSKSKRVIRRSAPAGGGVRRR